MRVFLSMTIALAVVARAADAEPKPSIDFQSQGLQLPGPSFRYDASFDVVDWNDDGKPDLFLLATGTVGGQFNFNEGTLDKPRFGHSVYWPFNSTETFPQTIEHVSSYAWCDLHNNGLNGLIFFDGQLRYCPNTGTRTGPFHWRMWKEGEDDRSKFFPGTDRFVKENARFSTGPESMFWDKGIFARQVLTLTAADWDGDGLQDLLICRFKQEAPGVFDLGRYDPPNWRQEQWTAWGRIRTAFPHPDALKAMSKEDFGGPLANAPERGLYFYKNVGTKETPKFDAGVEITTPDGKSISAPNPMAADIDGDGVLDLVSSETPYRCNAFRVDWPTAPHVVWFQRTGHVVDKLAAAKPLMANGKPVPAGTAARLADFRKMGVKDLLVMDPGGSIRWYRNSAATSKEVIALSDPEILRGTDFLRFEFMFQPIVVDWFDKGSRDLILHGCTDAHCKWALRRTALFRNVGKQPGDMRYEFVGYLNYAGDPTMVSPKLEEHHYEIYGSSMNVFPDDTGRKQILMSVGGKLYLFSDLAADGLTFQKMQSLPLAVENNRHKGWQEIAVQTPEKVRFIRIMNDRNGIGNLRDGLMHIMKFEAYAGGKNIATPDAVTLSFEQGTDTNYRLADNPQNMFLPENPPNEVKHTATSFGYYYGPAIIELKVPVSLEKICFLLSDRDQLWYQQLAPFGWQGKLYRLGLEQGQNWYQYKVEVSADNKEWTVVADRTKTEILASHPHLVDWDKDGRIDLLLGVTSANGVFPQSKTYRLYRNHGTNTVPVFKDFDLCTDENGSPLKVGANWAVRYAPQCSVMAYDLYDQDGKLDLIVESQEGSLACYRNVSENSGGLRFKSEGHVASLNGKTINAGPYRYFYVGDVDRDQIADLIDSGSGLAAFYKGVRKDSPPRVEDLVAARSDASGVHLEWSRPGDAVSFDVRWSPSPITEANWNRLPGKKATYDTRMPRASYTLAGLPQGQVLYVALKSLGKEGAASGISNAVEAVVQPLRRIVLRNGPAGEEGVPEYDGMLAVDVAASPQPAEKQRQAPGMLEVRSQDSNTSKGSERVVLLRFSKIPRLGELSRATLEMTLEPRQVPAGMTTLAVSCNAIHDAWDPKSVSWSLAQVGRPWQKRELESGGTSQSFLKPVFTIDNRRRTWDVTDAVRDAQQSGKDEVNLLVRVDYTGHYVAGQALRFCGPDWKDVNDRPQLVLITR